MLTLLAGLALSVAGGGLTAAAGAPAHSSWADPQVVIGIGGMVTGLVVSVTGLIRTFRPDRPGPPRRRGRGR